MHTVSFPPSEDVFAFVSEPISLLSTHCIKNSSKGQDSTIGIAYPGSGPTVRAVRTTTLPLVTLVWTSKDSIVAADHDYQPYVSSETEVDEADQKS